MASISKINLQNGTTYDLKDATALHTPFDASMLPSSGVSAGTYGPTSNQTPSHGGTFVVPSLTTDDKGRITNASTKSVILPTYSKATASLDGLMSATDKSKLDSITTVPLSSGLNMTEGTDGLIFTYVN